MFAFESLLWVGLPLVALPVLIHLINLMRHRRVKWAAMEFLLQSQKRHKKWIILKQLLLLLLRMAAVAVVVLMLAQPLVSSQWGALFGGAKTHHILLLDDSYSMSDRQDGTSAFERAKAVAAHLAQQAAAQGSGQTFSLLRFSGAAGLALGSQPDIVQENVDGDFVARLQQALDTMQPSQTAAGVADALDAVRRLPTKAEHEDRVLYIISDFRTRQWNEPRELRKTLRDFDQSETTIHLVHCADSLQPNLAISALKPRGGTRAAGVELLVDVSVTNFGDQAQREVAVQLEEDGHSRPGLIIKEIPAGGTATRSFRVNFPASGQHTVSAALPGDAVAADNTRYAVIDLPDLVPVLLIDGDPKALDAYFLATAMAPGGSVRMGLKPQIETPAFLRKAHQLARFHAVFLLNIPQLDQAQIEGLEKYVAQGGGAAFFLGELCRAPFYNGQLYRDGKGLFPLPLGLPTDLLANRVDDAPDVQVSDHPVFRPFLAMRHNPLDDLLVERYFAAADQWKPATNGSVQVLAELRNGAPLVVEKKFGDGRVVAVLTKAAPIKVDLSAWNNWARTYSYVPAMFNLQSYLAEPHQPHEERTVGQPLAVHVDPQQYASQMNFSTPRPEGTDTIPIDAVATPEGLTAALNDTRYSGVYTVALRPTEPQKLGQQERRLFAYNVVPAEGDLHLLDGKQLAARLEGVRYHFHRAQDLQQQTHERASFNISDWLFYLLVAMLLGEQLLAYSASYHPPRKEVAR